MKMFTQLKFQTRNIWMERFQSILITSQDTNGCVNKTFALADMTEQVLHVLLHVLVLALVSISIKIFSNSISKY
jgi:hypothetical protein